MSFVTTIQYPTLKVHGERAIAPEFALWGIRHIVCLARKQDTDRDKSGLRFHASNDERIC